MASTHTTKITAKSEADYDAEYATKITVSGQDSGDVITIVPADSDVTLTIDKATAKMKLTNQDQVIWEEAESLKYDGTETVQTLKTKDEEYFYGGGQQNGFFSHKNRKILIENKSTWVSGGVSSPNPFYISTEGYGAMRNTFQPGTYYFVGDMKEVLGDYIELTGNPMFMPKYGFYQGNAVSFRSGEEDV